MADIDMPLAWRMQQDGYLMQINQLRDENSKLRELCADLKFCRNHNCLSCSHGRFCDLRLNERLRELWVV